MNLLHLEPIRFAKEILSLDLNKAKVSCFFPYAPTLSMILEASAQSSAAFSIDATLRAGFLVLAKDVELLQNPKECSFVAYIEQSGLFANQREFFFEFFNDSEDTLVARGTFMIVLE